MSGLTTEVVRIPESRGSVGVLSPETRGEPVPRLPSAPAGSGVLGVFTLQEAPSPWSLLSSPPPALPAWVAVLISPFNKTSITGSVPVLMTSSCRHNNAVSVRLHFEMQWVRVQLFFWEGAKSQLYNVVIFTLSRLEFKPLA